jgi:hypothetical protein
MSTKRGSAPILSKWYHELWLPTCAATYIIICLFDFIAMPIYTAIHNSIVEERLITALKANTTDATAFAADYEKNTQANKQWNPITLVGGGLFHLSFGALLAAGATTRGLAKKSEVEGYYQTLVNGAPTTPPGAAAPTPPPPPVLPQ